MDATEDVLSDATVELTGLQDIEAEYSLLSDLLGGFLVNPSVSRTSMRGLLKRDPGKFALAAVQAIIREPDAPGFSFLVTVLQEAGLLPMLLLNLPEARWRQVMSSVVRVKRNVEAQLLRYAEEQEAANREASLDALHRAMMMIEEAGDCSLVVHQLMKLIGHTDPRIRCKAAKLLGRTPQNPAWFEAQMMSGEPRFRASLLEGMMSRPTNAREQKLIWDSVADAHHRVATTALAAAFLHGKPEEASATLIQFLKHPSETFRIATVWAMGRTGDERFLPHLQEMFRSGNWRIRGMAVRSMVAIRTGRGSSGDEFA